MYFYVLAGQNIKLKEGAQWSGSNIGLGAQRQSEILALSRTGWLRLVKSQALLASVSSL